jgi:hypothetical protein
VTEKYTGSLPALWCIPVGLAMRGRKSPQATGRYIDRGRKMAYIFEGEIVFSAGPV